MSHWLIPANTKFYDVFSALALRQTYWPMNAKISAGDIVYIYLAAPYKQLAFVCDVVATDYPMDQIIDQVRPFIKGNPDNGKKAKPFMKLKTVQTLDIAEDSALSLARLKQNGLGGMLLGARKMENNPELFNYIRKQLS